MSTRPLSATTGVRPPPATHLEQHRGESKMSKWEIGWLYSAFSSFKSLFRPLLKFLLPQNCRDVTFRLADSAAEMRDV